MDRLARPRLLLAAGCLLIGTGTLLLEVARGFVPVLAAQFAAAAGGTLVIPALVSLTIGIVGQRRFARQQGRNQAFNHAGIVLAALVIRFATRWTGPSASLDVLATMSVLAAGAVFATPASLWNARRAHGRPDEDGESETPPFRAILGDRRLLTLALSLALFQIGSGAMLGLLGQRLAAAGRDATSWTADYVLAAQLTMIPVALWAGSVADRRGRRLLLLLAFAALPVRAVLSAITVAPLLLIPAELLDGLSSGLVGVAVPVIVADLTARSGRTQFAFGTINAVQGAGGALSGIAGGAIVTSLGWRPGLLALGLPGALALLLVIAVRAVAPGTAHDGGGKT